MILDVVIPVYNKEKQILSVYNKINDELHNIKHRLIFVDNFSTDKTLEELENIYNMDDDNVKVISMATHNKDMAIYSGLFYSKHELVCIYDMDLELSVSYITKMYDLLSKNKSLDQVCLCSNQKDKRLLKDRIYNFLLNTKYDSSKTYYRMFRQEIVSSIVVATQNIQFSIYSFDIIGFNTEYINVKLKNNNSIISFKQLSNYSNNPLYIVKYFSFILLFISIILLILMMFTNFKINNELLLVFILLFNSINIFLLSILSANKNKINKSGFYIRRKIGYDEDFL